jgi:hypothetical protein
MTVGKCCGHPETCSRFCSWAASKRGSPLVGVQTVEGFSPISDAAHFADLLRNAITFAGGVGVAEGSGVAGVAGGAGGASQVDPLKPVNPKDGIGNTKLPLHLWPTSATAHGSLALLDGMLKYGRLNWRGTDVRASVYVGAMMRHAAEWLEGQTADPKSGLHPLAHALACIAILLDAEAAGTLIDDRNYPGGYADLVEALTPHVARLQALYADVKAPHHWTIQDAIAPAAASVSSKDATDG